jgi:hypothetical protein
VMLFEIHTRGDAEAIFSNFPEFKYTQILNLKDRLSQPIIMSKFEINQDQIKPNVYNINNIQFNPIHLNAYSPKKRYTQVRQVIKSIENNKFIILGDTNFWLFKNYFLSNKDKLSYSMLTENMIDISKHIGLTMRTHMSPDKVFISRDLQCESVKVVKHHIGLIDHYMLIAQVN